MTRDGTYVRGRAVGHDAEIISIEIKQCESKGQYHGRDVVRASDISVVYMKKGGSVAASVGLGAAGGFGGLLAGTYAWYEADWGDAGVFAVLAGLVKGIAGGA